ncbi:RNA polymerase sigma factor [Myxococcota bacterium]|nr:RNA polymerase sigma factor [Myxococcota bacterium]MBU1381017.1 RNA polymerase sigma factor [Myxococcota bacterium]MBU1502658.1 RNA polymerase sigma factor [bacterium]
MEVLKDAFPLKIEPDNRELISGLISRNPEAGRVFFNRFHRRVNTLVWRIMGADSEHDDLVQEILMAAVKSIHQIVDPELLDGWVTGIAVNICRKEIRSRKLRRFFMVFGSDQDDIPSSTLDPEKQACARQLYRALDQLGADEKIAFILCMFEELTQTEAATACNCSLSTLKRRLGRAQGEISKILEREVGEKRKTR